jgi:polysaccharide biosynthesis/export protein
MNLPSCNKLVPLIFLALLGVGGLCEAQNEGPAPGGSLPAPEAEQKTPATPKVEAAPGTQALKPAPQKSESKPASEKTATASPERAGPKVGSSYVIGPLDLLSIQVWNQAQISGPYEVQKDGTISVPLVGEVKADGLTQAELKQLLTDRLGEVALTSPEVNVQLLKNNSKRFAIYGPGVQHQGLFPLVETTTVMDALALAGHTEFAKLKKIEIRRGKEVFHFNEQDFINRKNMDKNINIELQPGDQIIVKE